MRRYLSNESLLQVPAKRAAFSDRTAYVMAEMSRLAYFKFEGGNNLDEILNAVRELVPEQDKFARLENLIKTITTNSSPQEAENILRHILSEKGFELINTWNNVDTDAQAFLCRHSQQKIAVLAFRGTESNLKDIKTDVTARFKTVEHEGVIFKIHGGYYNQFESLREDIHAALHSDELKEHQLFVTGHSLGGALAITAVKFLANNITGACYTFGSPPVGTGNFDLDIKTPIYRIVNHVDIVPRLPNPILVYVLRGLGIGIELVLTPFSRIYSRLTVTSWYKNLEKTLLDAQKYRQSGYGSYLVGNASESRLRYSVGVFDQLVWWFKQFRNLFRGEVKILSDHSIELYSKKLEIWAKNRN